MTEPEEHDIELMDADIAAWTAGSLLRKERERRGMSEKSVADGLHITMHYVRAIEADNYEKLPGTVFARGYIRSYAHFLGLDEIEIISLFESMVQNTSKAAEPAPVNRPYARRRRSGALPWLLLALAAFLIGYLVYWGYNRFLASPDGTGARPPTDAAAIAGESRTPEDASRQGYIERPAASSSRPAPQTPSLLASSVDARSPSGSWTVRGQATHNREIMDDRLTEVRTLGPDLLEISFSASGWIDVVGPDSRPLYRDMHRSGDILRVTGKAPFSLLIGDARAVDIRLNERKIDLEPEIRIDNTARLRVGI